MHTDPPPFPIVLAGEPGSARAVPTSTRSPVAVVVPTRDRPSLLRATLGLLGEALQDGDELVVVDSASRHGDVGALGEAVGAKVVRCDTPGASRARNAGVLASSAELIAFVDDDCLVQHGWIEGLLRCFESCPQAAFVTGAVLADPPAKEKAPMSTGLVILQNEAALEIPPSTSGTGEPGGARNCNIALSVTTRTEPAIFDLRTDLTTIGHGANMAWRRQALERIGGFDERLGPGTSLRAAEDLDAFWRALLAGMQGAFTPDAVVVHRQWRHLLGQLKAYYGYGVGSGAFQAKRWRLLAGSSSGSEQGLIGRLSRTRSASRLLSSVLWDEGATAVGRRLAEGYETAALAEACKTIGALQGAIQASVIPLNGTVFSPRQAGRAASPRRLSSRDL